MWSSVQRGLLSVARSAYVEQARLWASGPGAWLALLAVKLASDGGEQDRVALAAVATGTYVLTTALVVAGLSRRQGQSRLEQFPRSVFESGWRLGVGRVTMSRVCVGKPRETCSSAFGTMRYVQIGDWKRDRDTRFRNETRIPGLSSGPLSASNENFDLNFEKERALETWPRV